MENSLRGSVDRMARQRRSLPKQNDNDELKCRGEEVIGGGPP